MREYVEPPLFHGHLLDRAAVARRERLQPFEEDFATRSSFPVMDSMSISARVSSNKLLIRLFSRSGHRVGA
jgi:hypothetical protein